MKLWINRILSLSLGSIFISLVALLSLNSSAGFDITDESFILLWTTNPEQILASTTLFGYLTRWLYLFSGSQIFLFRIFGIFLLLLATFLFSLSLLRYIEKFKIFKLNRTNRLFIVFLNLVSVMAYYEYWILTPSYNWLNLIGILLVGAGLLFSPTYVHPKFPKEKLTLFHYGLGVLLGCAGAITFMAKPTTAVLLAFLTLVWVAVYSSKYQRWIVLASAAIVSFLLLFLHAVVQMGGVQHFYDVLQRGAEQIAILRPKYKFSILISHTFSDFISVFDTFLFLPQTWIVIVSVIFIRYSIIKPIKIGKFRSIIYLVGINALFLTVWFQLFAGGSWDRHGLGHGGLILLLTLITFTFAPTIAHRKNIFAISTLKHLFVLVLFLFFLGIAYAFGSGNGFMRQISGAYIFICVGAGMIALWISQNDNLGLKSEVILFLLVFPVLLVIIKAYKTPYRLPGSISEQVVESSFLNHKGTIRTDKSTAHYISDLKRIAQNEGWEFGTPLIDMTGASPGANVILGGRILGFPWLSGGYKGSEKFVNSVLELVPDSLRKDAWVLTAPEGRRRISLDVLSELGLHFPKDYKSVGQVKTGYRSEVQILWKPKE